MKFKVIKKYLLTRLEKQDKSIKKNTEKVEANMTKIEKMKTEIHELKTSAKNFNAKDCTLCNKKLTLPSVHFMCGHTYHDYCIESDGKRKCPECHQKNQDVIEKKEQFAIQAKETEQFFRELDKKGAKFNVVAQYFGRGLF
jgi:hypothetical protein